MPLTLSTRPYAAAVLLLLVVLTAGCRRRGPAGPVGPAGPLDTATLPSPTDLRLAPHPAGPPSYVLRWQMDQINTPISMFVVYGSAQPLVAADPTAIVAVVPGAARSAELTVAGDSGLRHLRVSGVSETGVEGALSAELVIDTTARVIVRDELDQRLYSIHPGVPAAAVDLTQQTAPAFVQNHALAPDGRRIAFLADLDTPGTPELYVRMLDGSDQEPTKVSGTLVANGFVNNSYAWSPDGRRLAFVAYKDTLDAAELFVVDVPGGAPRKVSGTLVAGGSLDISDFFRGTTFGFSVIAWSPDNRHLAYLADQRVDDRIEVMICTADGTRQWGAVGNDPPAGSIFATEFRWSPEGGRLAFDAPLRAADDDLYVVAATPGATPVPVALAQGPANIFRYEWSPDGTRLAFVDDRRSNFDSELFVVAADGSSDPVPLSALQATDFQGEFRWSPDGTMIAFVADRPSTESRELFVAPATGGTVPATLTDNQVVSSAQDLEWSPDGTQIAFRDSASFGQLWATPPGLVGTPFLLSRPFDAVRSYAWSTEGDRIAYLHDDGEGTPILFVQGRVPVGPPFAARSGSQAFELSWSRLGSR
ncbi:MAG: TolB family protein [Planctomycetota bacterium]